MHYKHEAFRFKYDTESLVFVETKIMPWVTYLLYINAFVYYIIVIALPIIFLTECGGGISILAHGIYFAYSLLTVIFEISVVVLIQKKV